MLEERVSASDAATKPLPLPKPFLSAPAEKAQRRGVGECLRSVCPPRTQRRNLCRSPSYSSLLPQKRLSAGESHTRYLSVRSRQQISCERGR